MKSILTTLALLLTLSVISQQKGEQYLTYGLVSAPGTYINFGHDGYSDDGPNIGYQVTYNTNIPYVGLEMLSFPSLNDSSYLHLIMRTGINQDFKIAQSNWLNFNARLGARVGGVVRDQGAGVYATLGWESGIDYRIPLSRFYQQFISIGINYSNDLRTDGKAFDPELDSFTTHSTWVTIGYTHKL